MSKARKPYATARMLRFKWSRNTKQHKTQIELRRRGQKANMWTFNLPQFAAADGQRICPFAGTCAEVCYASQGWYMTGKVKASYEHNLAVVRRADKDPEQLAAFLLADVERLKATHVRLHDSGDFFAPWYVDAWIMLARELFDITFYAYTKSIPLVPWDSLPKNVSIVQSLGGTRDDLVDRRRSHSAIFPSGAERRAAGYVNGNRNDVPAIEGQRKIGLVYHGQFLAPRGSFASLLRVVRAAHRA